MENLSNGKTFSKLKTRFLRHFEERNIGEKFN